ncbi:threonine synthase [Bacteroidota bacterium]
MNFVSHLEGAIDGARLSHDTQRTLHEGRPILVRYDLDKVRQALSKSALPYRRPDMWRLSELLPLESAPISLGENMTPVLPCPNLGKANGLRNVWVKDESTLPTGSFKSRGQAVAISMAKHFGTTRVAIPTAGNAGGAMAAYAARAGLEAFVFMPEDTPRVNQVEAMLAGAKVFLVNGLIDACGKIVQAGKTEMGWFDISTLKEPYRLEGKKTMGFEVAEQFGWTLPDVILYPTGGGTGLIGMWKAFKELAAIGWIDPTRMPRMVAVQSEGCAPVVRAFESGSRFCTPFEHADTIARGIRVPSAVGDFLILDAVRESHGRAVAVREDQILPWMRKASSLEGISFCPESAACVGALEMLAEEGWIRPNDHTVIFNCASARKYSELVDPDLPRLDITTEIDWDALKKRTKAIES